MQSDTTAAYPPFRLEHLERLTDDTGIVQHAIRSVPDPLHGYSIDDQARALIAVLAHARLAGITPPRSAYTYMSYLRYASKPDGTFHNFLAFNRTWLDEQASDDAHGRALWSLGHASRHGHEAGLRGAAEELFDRALPFASRLAWPRSCAFALFGLHERFLDSRDVQLLDHAGALAARLAAHLRANASADWVWFEDILTYDNAKMPAALLLAFELTGERAYRDAGLSSLMWLATELFDASGTLHLVGQDGWFPRGGARAQYDEQCVDAQGMVEAALIAWRVTGDNIWRQRALSAFDWFMGRNARGLPLLDAATGGCYDGITETGLNRNMGAESIVCYLLAYADLVASGVITLDGAIRA